MQKDSVERSLKSCAKGPVGQAQNSENVKTFFNKEVPPPKDYGKH
jgi:hypothetical protein